MKSSRFLVLLFLGLLLVPGWVNAAAKYPVRPITFIIPFPPGGNADIAMRPLFEAVGKELGVEVVITPVPGASTITGTTRAMTARPDGYTIGVNVGMHFSMGTQTRKLRYYWEDIEYIATVAAPVHYLGVAASSPIQTFDDFVEFARKSDKGVNIGQVGQTGMAQVISVRLMERLGYKAQPVPFDGGPPTVAAILGGHVDAGFTDNFNSSLRALLLTGTPSKHYPDTPTLEDLGHGDITMGVYYVIVAPKGTPKAIVERLEAAIKKSMDNPMYLEILNSLKWDPYWLDSTGTRAMVERDAKAVKVLIDQGIIPVVEN